MLVLSRKPGESIIIGGRVVVKIIRVDEGGIKIGIEAPPNVSVHREEIQARVEATKPALRLATLLGVEL